VTCCPKFISSFHVWFRGQDAASEAHHSRNTHVVAHLPDKDVDITNMISIREIDYETDEEPEIAFSRLTWAVERVDGLVGQLITNLTVDTNRPWVGVYDKNNHSCPTKLV